jgi:type I restriction enzyme S subunit
MTEVALSEVCKIRNGFAFKSTEFKNQGAPLIRISSFEDGPVFFDNRTAFVNEAYLDSKKDFLVEKGDILIALSGATTGKYGFYSSDSPSLLNQRVGIIKSGRSEKLNSRYFYHYLTILKSRILEKAGGAAQPNISTKQIGEFKIPLPPLPTQKKIAAILDAADAHRQKTKQLLAKYDELAQSIFLEMFGDPVTNPKGWEVINFDELVSEDCPLTYGIVQPGEEYEHGIPCVRPVDLTHQYVGISNLKKIDPSISKKFKRTILKGGELLLSVRGSVGVLSIAKSTLKGCNVTRGIVPIWFDSEVSNKIFFYYLYKSISVQRRLSELSKGATLIQINLKDLRDLRLIKPRIETQNRFAERVSLIEEQIEKLNDIMRKSEDLFNSLLQKAFKGELGE